MSKLANLEKISADPAAGSEIIFTADEDMIVHSLVFQLITDATVANRTPTILADDGNDVFFRASAGVQTASVAQTYCAFAGSAFQAASTVLFAFPATGLRLRKGDRLRTSTNTLQAGDNYGPMVMQVERI